MQIFILPTVFDWQYTNSLALLGSSIYIVRLQASEDSNHYLQTIIRKRESIAYLFLFRQTSPHVGMGKCIPTHNPSIKQHWNIKKCENILVTPAWLDKLGQMSFRRDP